LFTQNQRRLEASIRALQTNQRARSVHLGTLEGLSDVAVKLAKVLFETAELRTVFVDVFDRSDLEGKFLSGDLDLIINDRLPAQNKPRYSRVLGYQNLNKVESTSKY